MTKRASLPGASELFFRSTSAPANQPTTEQGREDAAGGAGAAGQDGEVSGDAAATSGRDEAPRDSENGKQPTPVPAARGGRRGSPRTKHDAKITVYVSQDELLALEHARLELRGTYDLAVDRGRVVREAVAVILSDFEERGESSVLVQRLRTDDDDQSRPS
ncbi:cobyrinic acid a,c-diamide synthase [Haloechinothrix sp. LS1_15]|uniref:cobyrinic acid a,c-diamide synthase n=1 Tax=Haloechinothrix sp. LS1_15 TaxID=2652248 RepID=UPI002944BBD3|nr:cobyrinic acid a,c-diamide synthase [Haloechinothrix sp. LS1_15]MDV6013428.1 cobyrinic acid a,c-diamide synthase [Haloechinothrix sp. LS1_15]